MHSYLETRLPELISICRKHKVSKLYAFGSVVNGNFTDQSDVDLIAEIDEPDPLQKGELWWSLYETLRQLLHREVDIISEKNLKNPYFIAELNETKQLIYG